MGKTTKKAEPKYLAHEIAHALSPAFTSTDQYIYAKQIILETIQKHLLWIDEQEKNHDQPPAK